jgi:hypothetical protein
MDKILNAPQINKYEYGQQDERAGAELENLKV